MKIENIQTSNFKMLSGDRTFVLPDGIIGVTGGNGQGKSTLMTAIAYALYGPEVASTGTADLVTWGSKKASVQIELESDKDRYWIRRGQDNRGTSNADISRQTYPTRGYIGIASGPSTVNTEVEKLLGVDRVGFQVSVFSKQEDLLGIGSLQPARRTSTILRLLGLDLIDKGIKTLGEQRKEIQRNLDGLRFSISKEPEDLGTLNDELVTLLETLGELEHRLGSYVEQKFFLKGQVALFEKKVDDWGAYNKKKQSLMTIIDTYKDQGPSTPEPIKPDNYIDPKQYEKDRDRYDNRQESYNKALNQMVCPTCGRPFDNGEERDHLETEREELGKVKASLEEAFTSYVMSEAYSRQLESYQAYLERVRMGLEQAERAQRRLDALEPVEDVTEAYAALQVEIQDTALNIAVVEGKINQSKEVRDHLTYRISVAKVNEEYVDTLKNLEEELLNLSTAITEMQTFKSNQIARVIPTLSETASQFIGELTDGKYTELALTPTYDIQYRNEQGDLKSFGNLSGGERDSFALALRLSIADLRASKIGILVLDEVLESLDEDRQEATWRVLEKLSTRFNQVFVVTHVSAFKDRAPFAISL